MTGPQPEFVFPLRRRHHLYDEGDPEIYVADEQADHPVDVERWQRLAELTLAAEGVRGNVEFALLFVDLETITDLNDRFLGHEGPTDVLSFPLDDDLLDIGRSPDAGTTGPDRPDDDLSDIPVLLGDVVVCPAVAAANAPTHAGTYDDELALLIVHGILHVLGHDHADEAETAVMRAREREHLAAFAASEGRESPPEPLEQTAPESDPEQ